MHLWTFLLSSRKSAEGSTSKFTIVRELTGGIYFGARKEDDGSGEAWDSDPYSRGEIERITWLARLLGNATRSATTSLKSGQGERIGTLKVIAKGSNGSDEGRVPNILFGHQLIDSAAMLLVKIQGRSMESLTLAICLETSLTTKLVSFQATWVCCPAQA